MTIEELLVDVMKDGRVCPMPTQWNLLWELLPDRQRKGSGWEPPVPLILAAWHDSSNVDKRDRFLLHLRWAYERGAIDVVVNYLSTMKPEDWLMEI